MPSYTGKGAEMSYAVTDGSYSANGASGCVIWMDSESPVHAHLSNALLPWRFQRREIWSRTLRSPDIKPHLQ